MVLTQIRNIGGINLYEEKNSWWMVKRNTLFNWLTTWHFLFLVSEDVIGKNKEATVARHGRVKSKGGPVSKMLVSLVQERHDRTLQQPPPYSLCHTCKVAIPL